MSTLVRVNDLLFIGRFAVVRNKASAARRKVMREIRASQPTDRMGQALRANIERLAPRMLDDYLAWVWERVKPIVEGEYQPVVPLPSAEDERKWEAVGMPKPGRRPDAIPSLTPMEIIEAESDINPRAAACRDAIDRDLPTKDRLAVVGNLIGESSAEIARSHGLGADAVERAHLRGVEMAIRLTDIRERDYAAKMPKPGEEVVGPAGATADDIEVIAPEAIENPRAKTDHRHEDGIDYLRRYKAKRGSKERLGYRSNSAFAPRGQAEPTSAIHEAGLRIKRTKAKRHKKKMVPKTLIVKQKCGIRADIPLLGEPNHTNDVAPCLLVPSTREALLPN